MNVRLLPDSSEELISAVNHHEAARPGYGMVFAGEYQYAVDRLTKDPDSYARVADEYRSISLLFFPTRWSFDVSASQKSSLWPLRMPSNGKDIGENECGHSSLCDLLIWQ